MDYPGKVITKTQVTPTQTSASGNWTLDDQAAAIKNNNWPVALVPNPISKSLRFNSADSAYLNRTPASAGNRKTWTFSCWVKKSTTGSVLELLSASPSGGGVDQFFFGSGDTLNYYFSDGTVRFNVVTASVYRDPSAWYHVILAVDTTQATSTNRAKIYVNGTEASLTTGLTYAPQNQDTYINNSNLTAIGSQINGGSNNGLYLNGYLTEVNFIDGQALTPSSFGMTNPQTGQWIPLKYSGTYGTNGFYLNFKDATSTTTLGYDYSGNANNWTTNNFSVTAGAGNDSLTDVPTPWVAYNTTGDVGGVIRGNYCTFNPLVGTHSNTYSDGNLQVATSTVNAAFSNQRATFGVSSGKWYWEITCQATNSAFYVMGITADTVNPDTQYIGQGNSYSYRSDTGQKATGGTFSAYGATFTTGDIISVVFDADAGTLVFYKNGATQGTAFTGISGTYFPAVSDLNNDTGRNSTFIANFGQRAFAYTAPSGFKALCTTNLPTPTIGATSTTQANDYFNAVTYTGNGTSLSVTGVGFQPDLIWIKDRSNARAHVLQNAIAGFSQYLQSNATDAETTASSGVTAVGSDGFTVGTQLAWNSNTETYVAWNWKASGTTSTISVGQYSTSPNVPSIASTVSANTTAGFSVVTASASGTSPVTVGHGCLVNGVATAPSLIIGKVRNVASTNWYVYSSAFSAQDYLVLNSTAIKATSSNIWDIAPTSTVFTVGNPQNGWANGNSGTNTYVFYCFAPVPGYSNFGSYEANNAADGVFVYLGFRPKWIMFKRATTTAGNSWVILDAVRNTYNVTNNALYPNQSYPENGTIGAQPVDFLSNGFKIRTSNSEVNGTGTYIYAAFAESPFKYSLAR